VFLLLFRNDRGRPDRREIIGTMFKKIGSDTACRNFMPISDRARRIIIIISIRQRQAIGGGTLRARRDAHRVNRVF